MTGSAITDPAIQLSNEDCALAIQAALSSATGGPGPRVSLDPETVERDLARLVLAVMEFLRQLLELQAIRRLEAGSLTEDEEERVGETLMRAREKLISLAGEFGLNEDELNLDLGPLGRLI